MNNAWIINAFIISSGNIGSSSSDDLKEFFWDSITIKNIKQNVIICFTYIFLMLVYSYYLQKIIIYLCLSY